MLEPQTWRELLGQIISKPEEEQRLCSELGIRSITLERWSTGESNPRPYNLQRLLNALPHHREQLIRLLTQNKEDWLTQDDVPREIPSSFYAQVLRAVAVTSESVRFWSICNIVLQQGLQQLDPEQAGAELSVLRCMLGEDGSIRSLRESVAVGTSPWRTDFAERNRFLGMESLPGYVVSSGHPAAVQSFEEDTFLPTYPTAHAASIAASPIRVMGRIAGCLLVSSTLPHFFLPNRLALINAYADLLMLAFQREDFFHQEQIKLRAMPSFQVQQPYLATFRGRVAEVLRASAQQEEQMSKEQAENIVRREIINVLTTIETKNVTLTES